MDKIKTVILVAAHKNFPMPDKEGYMPILVGASRNFKPEIDYQRDDQGENISIKNPNYNELTAIYWAWKNLNNVDAIGLVHYRRYFFTSKSYTLSNVMNIDEIEKLLLKNDLILPKKRNYYIESNYSHYIHAHHQDPIDKTRCIIEQSFPEYLTSFDNVMKNKKAHMFNMFIMNRKIFDSYCSFIFSVLEKLEDQIDISNYSVQEARVFGYISELLMDVWLQKNNFKYAEVNWGQIGGKQTLKKGLNLIKRKFGIGKKKTHF